MASQDSPRSIVNMPAQINTAAITRRKLPKLPDVRARKARALDADGDPLGITQRMDAWAQIVAGYPETVDDSVLVAAYQSLPGVDSTDAAARNTVVRYKANPLVQDRLAQYRRVLGTSRLSLLAHREQLHEQMVDRWQTDPEAKVRTADLLVSLKDRETVHGLHAGSQSERLTVVLQHPRVQAALTILATSPQAQFPPDNPNPANQVVDNED